MRLACLVPVLLTIANAALAQQQAATEATLRGKWLVPESRISEAFTFNSGQEFVHSYTNIRKEGNKTETTPRQLEGAYEAGPSACSAGADKGSLWIVQGSQRCCFTAYHMGKTLVLDEIRGGGIAPTAPLCVSRTLKRPG